MAMATSSVFALSPVYQAYIAVWMAGDDIVSVWGHLDTWTSRKGRLDSLFGLVCRG